MAEYFRVLADPGAADRWFLKAPVYPDGSSIDARQFTQCRRFGNPGRALSIPLRRQGRAVRFNLADFDMPVIDPILEPCFGANEVVELLPATVDGRTDPFLIVNVLECVSCVDEGRSTLTKWTTADGVPEKVGQYRALGDLKIIGQCVSGKDIFRIAGWEIALVVSDRMRRCLERYDSLGVTFQAVS